MEIRTIIIEDEKPAARLLLRKLEKLNIPVTAMLHSVEEALEWFAINAHPDVIFLDIQLSDGLSFEIFEKVDIKSAVIFTTAYDEYALKAFKLNSIDYLLKPIDEDDLSAAIQKFKLRNPVSIPSTIAFDEIKRLLAREMKTYKQRFTVKIGVMLKVIETLDIACIYSESKGTYLFSFSGRSYLVDQTLEQLEQELDPALFFRVSRKHLVSRKAATEISMYSNSRLQIVIQNYKTDEVIVSREKVADFKKWIS